jgi:hypothetical protein
MPKATLLQLELQDESCRECGVSLRNKFAPATTNLRILRLQARGDLQANSAMIDETIAPVRKPEGPHAANIESTTALLSPTGYV